MAQISGDSGRNKNSRFAVFVSSISLSVVIFLFYLPTSVQCRLRLIPESKMTDETQVLIAALEGLLNREEWSSGDLNFYGTPGDKTISLVDDGIPWPKCFPNKIAGYRIVRINSPLQHIYWQEPRLVGVRIDRLDLSMTPPQHPMDFFEKAPVVITIYNVGGSPDGVIRMGGTTYCYTLAREHGNWIVKPFFSFS